jgi:predicted anti-sigma-YlaC factor YlaD
MVMRPVRSSLVCDRVRAQVSLGLDGEISQLERAMLSSHLERCATCRAYQVETLAFTAALRAAPLEPLGRTITVQRPRRSLVGMRAQVAAAAALVVAALIGAGQLVRGGSPELEPVVPTRTQITQLPTQRQLEREQLILKRARVGHPVQIQGRVL